MEALLAHSNQCVVQRSTEKASKRWQLKIRDPFRVSKNALLERLLRNLSKVPNNEQNHPKGSTCPREAQGKQRKLQGTPNKKGSDWELTYLKNGQSRH
jgi:hypothetical protein